MSHAESPAHAPPARWWRAVGPALALASLGLALFIHHGVGPAVGGEAPRSYHPRGFLRDTLTELGLFDPGATALALLLPMVALAAAVVLTTRSALARSAAVASALAAGLFGYYAQRLVVVWKLYEGVWSATLVLFALVAAGSLCAVWLTRSWLRLPGVLRLATYLPVLGILVAFERNVTGTDPALPFALSPWPFVQVFALETFATAVAMLWLGVGVGILTLASLRHHAGLALALPAGLLLGLGLPVGSLALGTRLEWLPFHGGHEALAWLAMAVGASLAGALLFGWREGREPMAQRGRLFALAGLLLGTPLLTGQVLTQLDYTDTRQQRARRIVQALETYEAREGLYPERLAALVEAGDLSELPEPRIGFAALPRPEFRYDSFGSSYVLEFAAPRWIQCAYNPPWSDEADEATQGARPEPGAGSPAEDELAGAWSCPSNPPELW